MPEKLQAKPASKRAVALAVADEQAGREKPCGETIAKFNVRVHLVRVEPRHVNAFHLHVVAYYGKPAQEQERRLIGEVTTNIIRRGIVVVASQQLKLTAPVVVPTSWYVVLLEVLIVEEVGVASLVGIESRAKPHLQRLQAVEVMDVFSVELVSLILHVGIEHVGYATVIVERQDRSRPTHRTILNLEHRRESTVMGRLIHGAEKASGKRLVPLEERAHLEANKTVDIEVEHQARVCLRELIEMVRGLYHQGMVAKVV